MKKTLILLAGGQSRRMGENKAFLKVATETFIESILNKFEHFEDRIIVANDPSLYQYEGVKSIQDVYPNRGPVCGLYTGIEAAIFDRCVVLTVDTPFMSVDLMAYLITLADKVDAVIPIIEGRQHPLCGIYNKSALTSLKTALDKDERKVRKVLEKMTIKTVTEDDLKEFGDMGKIFQNINTPEEYKKAMAIRHG